MEYYIDKETNKRFESVDSYHDFISKNDFIGIRLHSRIEYEKIKGEEVTTRRTLGMTDCSLLSLTNILKSLVEKWKS